MAGTYIRFECGQEDRWTEEFGPYEYVQHTYEVITAAEVDGDPIEIAVWDAKRSEWNQVEGYPDQWYSDVVIYSK